jgi:hypothetical protein
MASAIPQLVRELEELRGLLRTRQPVLDGYLYQARIRCGRKACRCMSSAHRHSMWCLSYVRDGKSHTKTVPPSALPIVRECCERYRRLRRLRRHVTALADRLTAAIDQHIGTRAAQGWQRFEECKNASTSGTRT